jgi:hypothetical protein
VYQAKGQTAQNNSVADLYYLFQFRAGGGLDAQPVPRQNSIHIELPACNIVTSSRILKPFWKGVNVAVGKLLIPKAPGERGVLMRDKEEWVRQPS